MKASGSLSTSDAIAVFQAYVDLINSERETMWARHNALLVANSLIVGALTISPRNKFADLGLIAAGLVISGAWLVITIEGWSAVRRHVEVAGNLAASTFPELPNPFASALYGEAQTLIHRLILLVIAVFVLMYLVLGIARLVFA